MRNPASRLTRRREQARVTDLRTPPGGQPRYAGELLAAEAEAERQCPPGSLTPEAQRKMKEGLAEGIARHNAGLHAGERSVMDAIPEHPERDFPYHSAVSPAEAVASTLSASDAEELLHQRGAARVSGPQPTFTPHPAPAPTTEIPVLSGRNPGAARECPLDAPAGARGRLRDERRLATFAADRQELPFFGALTAEAGWQGLHATFTPPAHQYWTTDRWALHAMAEVAKATEAALSDVDAGLRAAYDRVFGPRSGGGAR